MIVDYPYFQNVPEADMAYDAANNVIWAKNKELWWIGFELDNGEEANAIQNSFHIINTQWDPVTGLIFGLGFDTVNQDTIDLVAMNTIVGNSTKLTSFPNIYGNMTFVSGTFDSLNRILYSNWNPNYGSWPTQIFGVNVESGKIVVQTDTCSGKFDKNLQVYNKPIHK